MNASGAEKWAKALDKAKDLIPQAAALQAQQAGIDMPAEAQRLWNLYGMAYKPGRWREFGDIAFHLAAAYRPDLAYALIYSFRDLRERPDPVPLIMSALEHLYHLRPEMIELHLEERTAEVVSLCNKPRELALRGGRILAREITLAPYPHATGIFASWDPAAKPILMEALREFNPDGAATLVKGSKAWLGTKEGIIRVTIRAVYRLLFGREG